MDTGSPTTIDLFCGGGGLSYGFESAGFHIVAGVDEQDAFRETYEHNHSDAEFLEADLNEISGKEILDRVELDAGDVDVVIGGPPCQGFSLAQANSNPGDERNFLVTRFIKAVYEIEPDWFLMENVPQIATMEDGAVREYIIEQFEKIGYTVNFKELNSVEFGVPQKRRRAFFIGTSSGSEFTFPEGTHRQSVSQTTLGANDTKPPVPVKDAISDLPALEPGEIKTEYGSAPQSEYQALMRDGGNLTNHKAPNHGEKVINRIKRAEQGGKIPYDSWSQKRRLSWDEPAPTLLGGPRPTYHFAHPDQHRGLSVRERARIQSFPDRFEFHAPIAKQRQITGNAVPPLLAEAIANSILSRISKSKQKIQ